MRQLYLSIICILLCSNIASAQKRKKNKKKESQKFVSTILSYGVNPIEIDAVYPGSSISVDDESLFKFKESSSIKLGFSYQKVKPSNWFYEISLTGLSIDKNDRVLIIQFDNSSEPVYGTSSSSFEAASRFEYGKYLFTQSERKKFNLGFSIGAELFFLKVKTIPANTAWFSWDVFRFGTEIQLIPILSFKPSNKFGIDLKIIPSLIEFYRNKHRIHDPSLSLRQQTDKSFSTKIFDDIRFSLIARYNLN